MSQKHDDLLDWWSGLFGVQLTAKHLAASLDDLSADEVPPRYYRGVVNFRHMSQKDRIRTCESYLRRRNGTG